MLWYYYGIITMVCLTAKKNTRYDTSWVYYSLVWYNSEFAWSSRGIARGIARALDLASHGGRSHECRVPDRRRPLFLSVDTPSGQLAHSPNEHRARLHTSGKGTASCRAISGSHCHSGGRRCNQLAVGCSADCDAQSHWHGCLLHAASCRMHSLILCWCGCARAEWPRLWSDVPNQCSAALALDVAVRTWLGVNTE